MEEELRRKKLVIAAEMKTATTTSSSSSSVVGVVAGKDLISSLPDELLHCIFSYLDVVHAIQCSVLSTRWRYLWTTLPYLNFKLERPETCTGDMEFQLIDRFRVFVDSVLSLRNRSTDIRTFRFEYSRVRTNEGFLSKWIEYAVLHNVEELDIVSKSSFSRYAGHDNYTTPSLIDDLCSNNSLRSLNLSICFDLQLINPSYGWPCLKYMHLQEIRFLCGEGLSNLISGCPVLETLIIRSCPLGVSESLIISSPQLKHLEISNLFHYHYREYKEYSMIGNIIVSTPKLESLNFQGSIEKTPIYSFGSMSSLMKASIFFFGGTRECIANVLGGLANVKSLSLWLDEWLFQAIFEVPQHISTTFHSLSFLKLTISQLRRGEIRAIAHLLEKCPNIERFELLTTMRRTRDEENVKHKAADFPSEFVLLHLKHVEIWNAAVRGEEELELLQFLKKNAANLKELVVVPI